MIGSFNGFSKPKVFAPPSKEIIQARQKRLLEQQQYKLEEEVKQEPVVVV